MLERPWSIRPNSRRIVPNELGQLPPKNTRMENNPRIRAYIRICDLLSDAHFYHQVLLLIYIPGKVKLFYLFTICPHENEN